MEKSKNIFLPNSKFPMRANYAALEERIFEIWNGINFEESFKNRKKFVLEFGPPYANGRFHMGHFLTYSLKDMVVRQKAILGFDSLMKTGHDTHGLPIEKRTIDEHKITLQDVRKNIVHFRNKCIETAEYWIGVQQKLFEKMAIFKRKEYYATHKSAEAIYEVFSKLVLDGKVFLDKVPTSWSIAEQTTIADIDIEYKDKESKSVYLKLKFGEYSIVIWTTTPWTLVDNVAVAYHKAYNYVLLDTDNGKIIVSEGMLVDKFKGAKILKRFKGSDFEGKRCGHPLYLHEVPLIHSNHVNPLEGTGFVHIAPAHGQEDFDLAIEYNLHVIDSVDEAGYYKKDTPAVEGLHVFKDEEKILGLYSSHLMEINTITHSYPYSSRSKTPIIYKTSEQVFLDISLAQKNASKVLGDVDFYPVSARLSLDNYIKKRKKWCISRQRYLGVPLALFVNKKTREVLKNEKLQERIKEKIREDVNFFFGSNVNSLLDGIVDKEFYDFVPGVLEVWFDSGCVWYINGRKESVDMYLEGVDQSRGWFQSSFILSYLCEEISPYKSIFTHGFVVDTDKNKMSKSLGNVMDLDETLKKFGVDILRIWIVTSDYHYDVSVGMKILENKINDYRKIRNVMRYLLGSVENMSQEELSCDEFGELDITFLSRLKLIRSAFEKSFNLREGYENLYKYIQDFSSTYLTARKDILYCDRKDSVKRKAVRRTLYIVLHNLTLMLAPFIPVTMEEVYQEMVEMKGIFDKKSVFLEEISKLEGLQNFNKDYIAPLEVLVDSIRKELEKLRMSGKITTDFRCFLKVPEQNISDEELANLLGVSKVIYDNSVDGFKLEISPYPACDRCHRYLGNLCERCDDFVNSFQ
jgi:isoleucyl-tRNA synthetase